MIRRRPLPLLIVVALVVAVGWWRSSRTAAPAPAVTPATTASTASPSSSSGRVNEDRRDLSGDEARGGHTLARHVGRSDDELRDRLRREPSISTASTYTDRAVAERVVARAIADNRSRIERWAAREGSRPNLALDYRGDRGEVIGRSFERGARASVSCEAAVVVLRWANQDYFVLTSYPETHR